MDEQPIDRMVAEHELFTADVQSLRVAIEKLAIPTIRSLVEGIRNRLPAHLRLEEDEIFPWMRRWLPERATDLDALLGEHPAFTKLCESLLALLDQPALDQPAFDQLQRLMELLQSHSAREQSLLGEALAREEGASNEP